MRSSDRLKFSFALAGLPNYMHQTQLKLKPQRSSGSKKSKADVGKEQRIAVAPLAASAGFGRAFNLIDEVISGS